MNEKTVATHKKMGYKLLDEETEKQIVALTNKETELLEIINSLKDVNERWRDIAIIDIQRGFMEIRRAISRPTE